VAAIEVLLHRYCTRRRPEIAEGRIVAGDTPLEEAFGYWAEGERAMRQGRPHHALGLLHAAYDVEGASDDDVVVAELLAAEAGCWVALDEPREAIDPAGSAWERWLLLANDPSPERLLPPARALLEVLSSPDPPPPMSDSDLLAAWLMDRLALVFQRSAEVLLGLLADAKQVETADEVARDFLAWIERWIPEGGQGLLRAQFARRLGDVYDRCDDHARALAEFQKGLRLLREFRDLPEITFLRRDLMFNAANQHAKLGQLQDALDGFTSVAELDSRADGGADGGVDGGRGVEPALRIRYAIAHTKYQMGCDEGLVEELTELAQGYERVLAASTAGGSDLDVRQGLDVVYRLWLKIEAERFDRRDGRGVVRFLHLVFALKEEEGKFCQVLDLMERHPDAAFHSEITVLLERLGTTSTGVLVVESVPDAILVVSLAPRADGAGADVVVQLLEKEAAAPAGALIEEQRRATDRLSSRAIPASSPPSAQHLQACQAMWQALDPQVREQIDRVRVLAVVLESNTDVGELPIEVLHDGSGYLALRHRVVRSPALRDLNLSLSANLVNARPTGAAVVVRAEDALAHADAETTLAVAAVTNLGMQPDVQRAPEPSSLLRDLGEGVDLLHYVGHGLADRIGEELPLGPGKRLTARGFAAVGPAPAPFTLLSACLAGRSRQLRTGHEHGFVTALLRRGAPAAIAASYMVPDHLAAEFFQLLYHFARDESLTDAMLLTRQALAEDGYHPAAWACFVHYGAAELSVGRPHVGTPSSWSEWAARYLASGHDDHLAAARAAIAADPRLPSGLAREIDADLRALAEKDGTRFSTGGQEGGRESPSTSHATLVASLLRSYGELRHADLDAEDREHKARVIVAQASGIERILGDSYLLVAAATEVSRYLLPFGDNRTVLESARRRLNWLTADRERLEEARLTIAGEEAHV
jgi:tetratricopeptide (TPR) repeat protein